MNNIDKWVPVAASLAGGLMAFLGVLAGQMMIARRDRKFRLEEANARREQIKDDFQRKTLLELQEAMTEFVRAAERVRVRSWREHEKTGVWPETPIDQEREYLDANARFSILINRTLDDQLRKRLLEVRGAGLSLLLSKSIEEDSSALARSAKARVQAEERIGEILRSLF